QAYRFHGGGQVTFGFQVQGENGRLAGTDASQRESGVVVLQNESVGGGDGGQGVVHGGISHIFYGDHQRKFLPRLDGLERSAGALGGRLGGLLRGLHLGRDGNTVADGGLHLSDIVVIVEPKLHAQALGRGGDGSGPFDFQGDRLA